MFKNNYIKIKYFKKITDNIKDKLIDIWEDSVKYSHDFLSDFDREKIKNDLLNSQVFFSLNYLICYDKDEMIGFLAFVDDKIEMLFLRSKYFNKGIGTALISKAVNNYHLKYVEVNKDNYKAYKFYQKNGFLQESEYKDEYGFIVLKMKF
ncbi:GNAT family N-acetyltransferase [Campylobacter lari]|uniref:GNAT family N-acetyltransferase n=2 Tax=Campylobacter lari TaxID=201 RepID=A0A698FSM4_CAMLA|nr:GNAT family N-acetyltransferase [Campylobacter lari]